MHHFAPRPFVLVLALALSAWGGGATVGQQSIPNGETEVELALSRVIEVAGRQGVATDGEHYYVSGSTALYVYSKEGELVAQNDDPFVDLTLPANHLGDISWHEGELYTGIEWFEDGRGQDIQIVVYDAATLQFKRSIPWEPESGQIEVSALAVDVENNAVWMTDWVNGNFVYHYDLETGAYTGKLHLRPVPQWQQGIEVFAGNLLITADDGDADNKEADNLWLVEATTEDSAAYTTLAMPFEGFRDYGEIEGLAVDHANNELLVLHNRGKRIVLGMPQGFYPGYDREISELYIYRIVEAQTDQ